MTEERLSHQMYAKRQEVMPPAVTISAGSEIVPYLRKNEKNPVILTPYQNHGRLAYVASTIRSRSALVETASLLNNKESHRLDQAFGRTMESLLDDGYIRGMAVMSSNDRTKPDVFVISVGDPYSDSCLRLYCHKGNHQGAPVLFQDGRGTRKTSIIIERELSKAGYTPPVDYDSKRNFGKSQR